MNTDYQAIEDGRLTQKGRPEDWRFAQISDQFDQSRDHSPHVTDEVFNAASHLIGLCLSILGTVLLISSPSSPWKIVSFSIYGASLIFLFACSFLHHAIVGPAYEKLLRKLDYIAIYPLIAGTFTPLTLVFYHDRVIGWAFCMTLWALSLAGITCLSLYFHKIPKWLSMTTYLTLGWLGACMTYWLIPVLGVSGFGLFLLGGIVYSVGGVVYTLEQPNPIPGTFGFHEIWHVAVMLAAALHWILMYAYVLPYKSL